MDFFVEQGITDQAVQALVRNKYGERARIMSRKEVRTGGFLGLFQKTAIEVSGYYAHTPVRPAARAVQNPEEERKKILQAARADESPAGDAANLSAVLREIRDLKQVVAEKDHAAVLPDSIRSLEKLLQDNDFSIGYADEIIRRARGELTMEELDDFDLVAGRVAGWIAETVRIHPWDANTSRPRVFSLVGPTGVGKTTTIAKLAAMYGAVADPPYDVRMITIDSYRIGAMQQIQKYGEIMNIPVSVVETRAEMQKQLALSRDADFVFIDTIGKSPRDFGRLAEVHELVSAAGGEIHLAVSATTKGADLREILRQFEPFGYDGVVVTKLDETANIGNIVSAMHEKRKSVSFITDGQRVPQDLERARVESFMKRLHGFPVNRRELEIQYDGTPEQIDRGYEE